MNIQSTPFPKLSEVLWFQIFKFLELQDFLKISAVSQQLSEFAKSYYVIYERECCRFFTAPLQLFEIETEVPEPILLELPPQIELIKTPSISPSRWYRLLRNGGDLLKQWTEIGISYEKLIPKEAIISIRDAIFKTIKEPSLPLPKLSREDFNVYKKTLAQNHVYELIFLEAECSTIDSNSIQLSPMPALEEEVDIQQSIQILENSLSSIISEIKENTTQAEETQDQVYSKKLLDLRWYRNISDNNTIPDKILDNPLMSSQQVSGFYSGLDNEEQKSFQKSFCELSIAETQASLELATRSMLNSQKVNQSKQKEPFIVSLSKNIIRTISFFCKLYRYCIIRDKDSNSILHEYCKRWSAFSAAMIELDETLAGICKLINQSYEACFPNYAQFPKFSFSRAMITLWKVKVFEKLKPNLISSFSEILDQLRQEEATKGKQMMENKKYKKNKKKRNSCEPSEAQSQKLFQQSVESLSTIKINKEEVKSQMIFSVTDPPMNDISDFIENGKQQLLSRFVQSIADISINDLKIHFLGSTKFEPDPPYLDLDSCVLEHTKKFYKKLAGVMEMKTYINILEQDCEQIIKIMLPSSMKSLQNLKQRYQEKCISNYVERRISQYLEKIKKGKFDEVQQSELEFTDIILESELGKFINDRLSKYSDGKQLASKFYSYFNGHEAPIADLFEKIIKDREDKPLFSDVEIDFMNKKRNIPFELSLEEKILYTYSQDVTGEILEDMYQKYLKSIEEEEEKAEAKNEDDPDHENEGGLGGLPPLDDEDYEDEEDEFGGLPGLVRS